jgi:uncharacterized protein (DUF2267 family)
MTYDEFIQAVEERAGVPRERAEAITRATLEALGERLTGGEARDLASQLPKPLQEPLRPRNGAEPFGLEELIRRVSDRTGVRQPEAADAVRAVLTTVREGVTGGEFDDVMQQLPDEFWQVIEPTSWRGDRSAEVESHA